MDMGPGDEDEGDGSMTGVWAWGYGEGVEGAAFWGWIEMLEKPIHAWAKAVRVCSPSRVTDNRVVYRGVKGGGAYPLNAVHERRGGFSEPKRSSKWLGRVESAKSGDRAWTARSVRDKASKSAFDGARQKVQGVETGTDTAKALARKNGGI